LEAKNIQRSFSKHQRATKQLTNSDQLDKNLPKKGGVWEDLRKNFNLNPCNIISDRYFNEKIQMKGEKK
jgi:hypothetical protein